MAKIAAAEVNRRIEEVAEYLAAGGYTDEQIMKRLNLKSRTFYYYKARVYEVFGDLAAKKMEERLEFEAEVLKDRYLRLFRNLEQKIMTANQNLRYIANASEVAVMIATNIFRLELEAFRDRQTRRELNQGEQKAIRYLDA